MSKVAFILTAFVVIVLSSAASAFAVSTMSRIPYVQPRYTLECGAYDVIIRAHDRASASDAAFAALRVQRSDPSASCAPVHVVRTAGDYLR